ncbi:hypothetical protein Tco_1359842 [Tanacetum coccineum]
MYELLQMMQSFCEKLLQQKQADQNYRNEKIDIRLEGNVKVLATVVEIEFLLHRDLSTPKINVVSILKGFTDEPPLEENDDLFDLESKENRNGGDIDEIDAFLDIDISTDIEDGYHDSEGDILYLESLLSNDTILSLPPKVFLDHDPRSLNDINDLKIMVKDCPDFEGSRARGFVHRSLDLQSFACLYMGIRYP